jgi:tetratricopeptide (TPR) repeat protein
LRDRAASRKTAIKTQDSSDTIAIQLKITEKVENYNKVIQLNPDDALAYNNRGNAYFNLGQYQRAIEDYNEAIRLKPDDALAYNNRGNAYKNLRQYQRAIMDYNEAVRL